MSDTEVITREAIVQQVRHALALGTQAVNPYPAGSDAHAAWVATAAWLGLAEQPESEARA